MKFKNVNVKLMEQTRGASNFVRLVQGGRDARDNNTVKYHTVNIVTGTTQESFKTLKEVIEYYNL